MNSIWFFKVTGHFSTKLIFTNSNIYCKTIFFSNIILYFISKFYIIITIK